MDASWAQFADPVAKLVSAAGNIADVKRAGNQASLDSQTVLLRANDLSEQIGKLPLRRLFPNVWWGLLGAIAAVAFALLLVITLVRDRSEEHTSELQSLMRISYAVFCLKKKKIYTYRISYYVHI